MNVYLTFIMAIGLNLTHFAQSYSDSLKAYHDNYKLDFLKEERSPIKDERDLTFLQFFEADEKYRITATFKKSKRAEPFEMATINGKTKTYIEYGSLSFHLQDKKHVLKIFQNVALIKKSEYKNHLFLPFTDSTNGNESYMNGRYLDFVTSDIKDNKLIIDFNKSYNPYCAYSSGYSCPKPPLENNLKAMIRAGEKNFTKGHE